MYKGMYYGYLKCACSTRKIWITKFQITDEITWFFQVDFFKFHDFSRFFFLLFSNSMIFPGLEKFFFHFPGFHDFSRGWKPCIISTSIFYVLKLSWQFLIPTFLHEICRKASRAFHFGHCLSDPTVHCNHLCSYMSLKPETDERILPNALSSDSNQNMFSITSILTTALKASEWTNFSVSLPHHNGIFSIIFSNVSLRTLSNKNTHITQGSQV